MAYTVISFQKGVAGEVTGGVESSQAASEADLQLQRYVQTNVQQPQIIQMPHEVVPTLQFSATPQQQLLPQQVMHFQAMPPQLMPQPAVQPPATSYHQLQPMVIASTSADQSTAPSQRKYQPRTQF